MQAKNLHPLFQLLAIFGPLITLYYFSRRFEYSADREAIEFTDAPEIAVQALAKLHQSRELPTALTLLPNCSWHIRRSHIGLGLSWTTVEYEQTAYLSLLQDAGIAVTPARNSPNEDQNAS